MNKIEILETIKQLQKEICEMCPEMEYEMCRKCKFHILTNKVVDGLKGG